MNEPVMREELANITGAKPFKVYYPRNRKFKQLSAIGLGLRWWVE